MKKNENIFAAWNKIEHTHSFDFWNKVSKSCMKFMFSSFEENKYLIDCLKKNKNQSVLDYGCASGYVKRFLNFYFDSKLKYTGIDISTKSIELAKKNYGNEFFTVPEYENSEIKSKKFDIVYSRDTIMHQEEPWKFITTLISKTNNFLILKLRTRDNGPTDLNVENSCQMQPGELWAPYIILNYDELLEFLKKNNFKFIKTNRSYSMLAGNNLRYLDKSLYYKKTGTAFTSVIASFENNTSENKLIEQFNLEGDNFFKEKKFLTIFYKILNKMRI